LIANDSFFVNHIEAHSENREAEIASICRLFERFGLFAPHRSPVLQISDKLRVSVLGQPALAGHLMIGQRPSYSNEKGPQRNCDPRFQTSQL
jgi:hypothetical protein